MAALGRKRALIEVVVRFLAVGTSTRGPAVVMLIALKMMLAASFRSIGAVSWISYD